MKGRAGSILAILTATMLLSGAVAIFSAHSSTEIDLIPSVNAFNTATTPVGFRFNVTAWVKDVSDLFAYQVRMYYDPTMINATRAWLPTWDLEWVFYGKTTVELTPVYRPDYVQIGDSILVGNTFAGTGKLAVIEFQAMKTPSKMEELSCTLDINNEDTYLLNFDMNDIVTLKTNGLYKYTWSPPPKPHLAVNPTFVKQPDLGSAFDIQIYIMELNAAWELTNATMSISFNTTIIDVVGGATNITIPSNWVGPNEVNVVHGVPDKVNITVQNPSVASGDILVATIRFTVINEGITSLSFNDYHLHDHVIEIPTDPPTNGLVNTEELVSDIAIINVKPFKTIVGQGSSIYIDVIVANEGDSSETFNVTVYGNTSVIIRSTISLSNGSTTTVSFMWDTTGLAKGNYTISAYAIPIPGEVDTADNTYVNGNVIVALIGDITGPTPDLPDGKVDIRDIATVAKAFGSYPGHSNWNPNADITGPTTNVPDNKIDIRDIATVAKNFGKIDP